MVTEEGDAARSIGSRLRSWRRAAGLSLGEASAAAGVSVGYISQVERGLANPSLETLKRLADAVGGAVGSLFLEDESARVDGQRVWVTRAGVRKQIVYPGSGIRNELLSPDLQHSFEAIWVEAEPGSTSGGHPHSHLGEECGVVLVGSMRLWVGAEIIDLGGGDSVYMDSTVPHRWVATGDVRLQAVWMIAPPTF